MVSCFPLQFIPLHNSTVYYALLFLIRMHANGPKWRWRSLDNVTPVDCDKTQTQSLVNLTTNLPDVGIEETNDAG